MNRVWDATNPRRRVLVVLSLLLVLSVLPLPASSQAAISVTINQVEDAHFPSVVCYLTISDSTGMPVVGLDQESIAAFEDEQRIQNVTLSSVTNVQEPISLALALDTSASMAGEPLESTRQAAISLVQSLSTNDQVSLFSFSDEVTQLSESTADKEAIVQALGQLEASGYTAFNDAVHEAALAASALPAGRKAVVVLTDGEDTSSTLTIDDAIDAARGSGIPVYTIGFGPEIQPETLERLSVLTGGHLYQAPGLEDLLESFRRVGELLRHQYLLSYESGLTADGLVHDLKVRVNWQGEIDEDVRSFTAWPVELTISLSGIETGQTVSGEVALTPQIVSAGAIAEVEYLVDGAPLETVTTSPFALEWDTTVLAPGTHTLTARAMDTARNEGSVEVQAEVMAPITISISEPAEGDAVSGVVPIAVELEAPAGVAKVEYLVDGEVARTVAEEPFGFEWNSAGVVAGEHTLLARAYDARGYSAEGSIEIRVQLLTRLWGIAMVVIVLALAASIVLPLSFRKRRRRLRNGLD